jgi:hypothetical protein
VYITVSRVECVAVITGESIDLLSSGATDCASPLASHLILNFFLLIFSSP